MNDMREDLKAYIDGELVAQQARSVEEALSKNPSLRQELDQMRRIGSTLREATMTASVSGLDKTLSELNKRTAKKRPPLLTWAPALGLLATCAIVLLVIGHGNTDSTSFADEKPIPMGKKARPSAAAETTAAGATASQATSESYAVGGIPSGKASSPSLNSRAPSFQVEPDTTRVQGVPSFPSSQATLGGVAVDKDSQADSAPALGTGKQIVKTGNISIAVTPGTDTLRAITHMATSIGGLVESSELTGDGKSGMSGTITIRVPVSKFDQEMTKLQTLGKVTAISSTGNDVTGQVVDGDAKLRTMKAQELDFEKILGQAKHVDDILNVRQQLDDVQQQIAEFEATQKELKGEAAMSTITINISQEKTPAKKIAGEASTNNWMDNTWAAAWAGLAVAGRKFTEAMIYLVVFCPIWIPFIVLANALTRRLRHAA